MDKIRIGFVPAHREPFDDKWAVQMRKRCLDALTGVPQLEVVVPGESLTPGGLVRDDGDAGKAIKLFKDKGIEGLIIGTMTFGDEVSALSIASAFEGLPLMLFGTREGPFTADGNRKSDSFCGTLAISSGLYRRKTPCLFAGILFPEEKLFKERMFDFVRVCAIVSGFIGARIGLVGPRPERFETCICNEDAMMLQFKQRVVPTSLLDIMQRAKGLKADSPELQKIVRAMKKEADLSLLSGETLKNMAGLQYALRAFAEEKGLAAMGIQCWTAIQEVYGISSCYSIGRLTDAGLLTACEVDIYGALTMLIQHLAALETTRPHFIDWTIQHQEKKNVFLAWHCGNAPPSLSCKGCSINLRSHSILSKPLGEKRTVGTAEFPLRPGVVTLNRLTERDGRFKMLITTGKIIQPNQALRGSWSWVQVEDLDGLYMTLVKEGFTHHASLIHGDYARAVKEACELLAIDTVIV
jgi:L-fucose isomerase-like protein